MSSTQSIDDESKRRIVAQPLNNLGSGVADVPSQVAEKLAGTLVVVEDRPGE